MVLPLWSCYSSFLGKWDLKWSLEYVQNEILDGKSWGLFSNEPYEKKPVMTIEDFFQFSNDHFESRLLWPRRSPSARTTFSSARTLRAMRMFCILKKKKIAPHIFDQTLGPWTLQKFRPRYLEIGTFRNPKTKLMSAMVPGHPITDCTVSPNNCVPRRPKLSTIDVTAKAIFFERVYLVSRTVPICALCDRSLCTHTPTTHCASISRLSCLFGSLFKLWPLNFFVSTIRQVIWPSPGTLNLSLKVPSFGSLHPLATVCNSPERKHLPDYHRIQVYHIFSTCRGLDVVFTKFQITCRLHR